MQVFNSVLSNVKFQPLFYAFLVLTCCSVHHAFYLSYHYPCNLSATSPAKILFWSSFLQFVTSSYDALCLFMSFDKLVLFLLCGCLEQFWLLILICWEFSNKYSSRSKSNVSDLTL